MNDFPFLGDRHNSAPFQIFGGSPGYAMLTGLDGKIVFANEYFYSSTGYTQTEVLGKTPAMIKSGLTPPHVYKEIWSSIFAGKVWEGELCNKRKSGQIYWVFARICPLFDDDGVITHFFSVQHDITRRKSVEKQNREIFRMMSDGEKAAHYGSWSYDVKSGTFVWTEGIYRLLDYDLALLDAALGPIKRVRFADQDSRRSTQKAMLNLQRHGVSFDIDISLITEQGRIIWVHLTGRVYEENGKIKKIGGTLQDITIRKEKSDRDGLTGLLNQADFSRQLGIEVGRANRQKGRLLSLLIADLDFFKRYNDLYGHQIGNLCLQKLGKVMREECARATDLLHRYGGDEFTVMFPDTDLAQAVLLAKEIARKYKEIIFPLPDGKSFTGLTLSIGIAQHIHGQTAEELFSVADTKLYEAKEAGRAQVCF